MRRSRIVTLAFLVALLGVTLHIGAPRPAAALTCEQLCDHKYATCLHGCGLMCIGDDACYAACSADCDGHLDVCLNGC